MAATLTKLDRQLTVLLRDFGYRFDGRNLIANAIRGFCGDEVVRRCRDLYDAAEQLRPIVKDDEYSRRHAEICG